MLSLRLKSGACHLQKEAIGITRSGLSKIGSIQREGIGVASAYSHNGSFGWRGKLRIVKDGSLLAEGKSGDKSTYQIEVSSLQAPEIISNGNHAP